MHCRGADWLGRGEVQKLVVVITGVETKEVLERWVFNIETDKAALTPGYVSHAALVNHSRYADSQLSGAHLR